MGLLSKFLGNDKEAEKALKDLFGAISKEAQNRPKQEAAAAEPQNVGGGEAAPQEHASGFSWGEKMPDEENQFNFNGTPCEYFENIFRSDFPAVRFEKAVANCKRTSYTFYEGTKKALVIELISQSVSPHKLRSDCEAAGIPYLRFYYDHDGWWNTRAYVVSRMRGALGGN